MKRVIIDSILIIRKDRTKLKKMISMKKAWSTRSNLILRFRTPSFPPSKIEDSKELLIKNDSHFKTCENPHLVKKILETFSIDNNTFYYVAENLENLCRIQIICVQNQVKWLEIFP